MENRVPDWKERMVSDTIRHPIREELQLSLIISVSRHQHLGLLDDSFKELNFDLHLFTLI